MLSFNSIIFVKSGKNMRRSKSLQQRPSLPDDFAQRIIKLEENISMNCKLSSIQELAMLYSTGVEYFESQKDLKHKFYQQKLHELLSKEEVRSILNNGNTSKATPCDKKRQLELKQHNMSKEHKKLHANLALAADRNAQRLLNQHYDSNKHASVKLRANIQGQSFELKKRLVNRRFQANKPVKCLQEIDKVMEEYAEKKVQVLLDGKEEEIQRLNVQKNSQISRLKMRFTNKIN